MQVKSNSEIRYIFTVISMLLLIVVGSANEAAGQQLAYNCMAGYPASENANYLSYEEGKNLELSEVYLNAGTEKENDEDYEGAISDYSRAIELKPDCAEAYDKRGMAYIKTFKFEKGIKDFNKALKILPGNAEAFNHRGVANYCIKQYDLALRDYTLAIETDHGYAKAYYNRGLLSLEMDEKESAFADLRTAMKLNHPDAARLLKEFFQ